MRANNIWIQVAAVYNFLKLVPLLLLAKASSATFISTAGKKTNQKLMAISVLG